MKKLLNQVNKALIFAFAASLLYGCGKESSKKNFVARVNDSYLTKEELAEMIGTNSANNFYKSEVIRNWINKELLYQAALKEGILKEDEFKKLLDDSKKELAASLLVQKYYENEKLNYEPGEVENFYNLYKNDFVRFYDSYYLNEITFSDEDKAIQFRSTLLESDWDKALNIFKDDSSIINVHSKEILYNYEIHPVTIFRIVSGLFPGEISTVINDEPGRYTVIQEIEKYDKGSIPPFDVIRSQVESRFIAKKKEDLINNYIKDLYSNNDIEVRN